MLGVYVPGNLFFAGVHHLPHAFGARDNAIAGHDEAAHEDDGAGGANHFGLARDEFADTRTYEQFDDNLAALEISFSTEQIQRLDAVSRIKPCFPHDMLAGDINKGLFGGVNIEKPRWR